MKRIGIIDFDTSHVAQFTMRLNHVGIKEDQWVEGAQIVVGCPGKSIIYPERIAEETAKLKKLDLAKIGMTLVDTPEEMLKHDLDAVFIESNSGMQHLERAKFFLAHKLPLFVDKPFACSGADAEAMFELADKAGVPIMSASSLRYIPEIEAFRKSKEAQSKSLGCVTWGPASTDDKNPGLFHYGIHAAEMLFAIMGTGCESVTNVLTPQAEVATGVWKGGRLGSVRGNRQAPSRFGFVTFSDSAITTHSANSAYAYRDLLKAIMQMLETGKAPIPPQETIEIVKFIEKAHMSASNHGNVQTL